MDATKAALLRALTNQRAHILEVVDSLDEDALLRPVLPSGWTCAGLVNHLWLDVERWWFLIVASAQQPMALEDTQVVWKAEGVSPAEAIAGHLDAARELINGQQYLVLE